MKRTLSFESVEIPFKEKFAHNTAIREKTETIIVSILNENGQLGFGESCPRKYVTGESIASVKQFLLDIKPQLLNVDLVDSLREFIKENRTLIDKNPAAWCGVEMAMLDIISREKNISVENILDRKFSFDKKDYTGVIGIHSFISFVKKSTKYRLAGFKDFKIKLSGDLAQDKRALFYLRLLSKNIRGDGNNLFADVDESLSYLTVLKRYLWAIEEPLAAHDFSAMVDLSRKLEIKIIIDESFLNLSSFESIRKYSDVFIPNVRISKMGGILRTMELVDLLEANNFQWIMGSHVGEMSLLTRASFLITGKNNVNLVGKEGAFSTHLITEDPFYPNLKLSSGGKVENISDVGKTGWGMTYRLLEK